MSTDKEADVGDDDYRTSRLQEGQSLRHDESDEDGEDEEG